MPNTLGAMKEVVTERFAGQIIASTLEDVHDAEIEQERQRVTNGGSCTHSIVKDEPGYLYDIRTCVICGQGLGAI
jgi:hypothetical protein